MGTTTHLHDHALLALAELNVATGPACIRSWLETYRETYREAVPDKGLYAAITNLIQWQYVAAIHNGNRDYYLITPAGAGYVPLIVRDHLSAQWDEFLPTYIKAGGRK